MSLSRKTLVKRLPNGSYVESATGKVAREVREDPLIAKKEAWISEQVEKQTQRQGEPDEIGHPGDGLKSFKEVSFTRKSAYSVESVFGISGVYYLYRGKEIVYIGEAACVMSRISTHFKQKVKEFDNFRILRVAGKRKRKAAEKGLIMKFKPLYNTFHNPDVSMKASRGRLVR